MTDTPTPAQGVPSDEELQLLAYTLTHHYDDGCWPDEQENFRALQKIRDRTEAAKDAADPAYFWEDGKLKWGSPLDVGHLIAQLRTLNPKTKVSSVIHIDLHGKSRARAYGLSMSRERWDEDGWLNYKLDVPACLAIWATPPDTLEKDRRISELEAELKSVRAKTLRETIRIANKYLFIKEIIEELQIAAEEAEKEIK